MPERHKVRKVMDFSSTDIEGSNSGRGMGRMSASFGAVLFVDSGLLTCGYHAEGSYKMSERPVVL